MRHTSLLALAVGALTAGIASPQSIPADVIQYLNLTQTQVESINSLNIAFHQYANKQENLSYDLQSQVNAELAKSAPDSGVVGGLYGQMAMISRAYNAQLTQVQSNVAAVLTTAQMTLVSGLLGVARLQPIVSEAQCAAFEPPPAAIERSGNFSAVNSVIYDPAAGTLVFPAGNFYLPGYCYSPIPVALVNYLNLSDAQNAAIDSAIHANQEYVSGRALKIQELQLAIQALTGAQNIDTATLGADYVAIAKIQRDETTQGGQLMSTVRRVLTDQQQPQLKALDNALNLSAVENEAVQNNILVLPPGLSQAYNPFGWASFLLGIPAQSN